MNEHIDWVLLAKYYAEECSEEERKRAESMINADVEARHLMALLDSKEGKGGVEHANVDAMWASVAEHTGIRDIPQESRVERYDRDAEVPLVRKVFVGVWRYAAVLFIAGGLAYFLSGGEVRDFLFWESTHQMVVNTTAYGERRRINLPDGTHVTLDAGSKLSSPVSFASGLREVALEGKAYFDVVSEKERPFVVRANRGIVEVLGTEFSVSAWPEFERVDVVVAEGRVALRSQNDLNGVGTVLEAGQMGTLTATRDLTEPKAVDLGIYMGWMTDVVAFQDVPLGEILFHLERQFDVAIALEYKSVAKEHLAISIEHPSLQEVLEVVCALTSLKYEVAEKHVRLFR